MGEYADALSRGAQVPRSTEYDDVGTKLHRYMGISEAYIRNSNLRIPYSRFESELLREQGTIVGRLDSRLVRRSRSTASGRVTGFRSDQRGDRLGIHRPASTPICAGLCDTIRRCCINKGAYDQIQDAGGWDLKHRGISQPDVTPGSFGRDDVQPVTCGFLTPAVTTISRRLSTRPSTRSIIYPRSDPSLRANITEGFYPLGSRHLHRRRGRASSCTPTSSDGTPRRWELNSMSRTLTGAGDRGAYRSRSSDTGGPAAPAAHPQAVCGEDAITHHAMLLHGKSLTYTARAGTIGIRDDKDKVWPRRCSTRPLLSTERHTSKAPDNVSVQRRPGQLDHMVAHGLLRARPCVVHQRRPPTGAAPFRLVANQQTLLDVTDLVFVDIADSGFGRIAPGADVKKYFSTDGDTAAVAQFIERYLNAFGRWNSPKFLFGESYGTARSALLSNYLQNAKTSASTGSCFSLRCSTHRLATPYDAKGGADTDDWQYVFWLPTLAATAYHYHMVAGSRRRRWPPSSARRRSFAMGEYREALAMGSKLPAQRRRRGRTKICRATPDFRKHTSPMPTCVSLGFRYVAELRRRRVGRVEGVYECPS